MSFVTPPLQVNFSTEATKASSAEAYYAPAAGGGSGGTATALATVNTGGSIIVETNIQQFLNAADAVQFSERIITGAANKLAIHASGTDLGLNVDINGIVSTDANLSVGGRLIAPYNCDLGTDVSVVHAVNIGGSGTTTTVAGLGLNITAPIQYTGRNGTFTWADTVAQAGPVIIAGLTANAIVIVTPQTNVGAVGVFLDPANSQFYCIRTSTAGAQTCNYCVLRL